MKRAKSVDDVVALIQQCMLQYHSTVFKLGKCKLTIGTKLGGKNRLGLQGLWLESKDRGQGEASKALTVLAEAADICGVTIILEAQPMNKQTNLDGLLRLYGRAGFILDRKLSDDNGRFMMVRKPHTKKATTMSLESVSRKLAVAGIQHRIVTATKEKKPKPGLKFEDLKIGQVIYEIKKAKPGSRAKWATRSFTILSKDKKNRLVKTRTGINDEEIKGDSNLAKMYDRKMPNEFA